MRKMNLMFKDNTALIIDRGYSVSRPTLSGRRANKKPQQNDPGNGLAKVFGKEFEPQGQCAKEVRPPVG